MHADKTMWNAVSQYCGKTLRALWAWYFGPGARRLLTVPLLVFSLFVALTILAYIPATLLSLYSIGGLFLLVLGVGPALVMLLAFTAVFYLSLPLRLSGWLEGRISSPAARALLIAAAMLLAWLAVGFLQLGYGYLIKSALV